VMGCKYRHSRITNTGKKNASTIRMNRHLETEHKKLWTDTLTRKDHSANTKPVTKQTFIDLTALHNSSSTASTSAPSSSISSTRPPSAKQSREWALRLLQVTAEMNLSFRALTESAVFRQWMKDALRWEVPTKNVLRRLLPLYYSTLVQQLKNQLETVNDISITTDSTYLTSHQQPYIAVTGHFIDDGWKYHNPVLSVFVAQQSEAGDYISKQLRLILQDRFKLSGKLNCIVTDEGSNFLAAGAQLKEKEFVSESLRCVCHRVQLVIKKSIISKSNAKLYRMINKCHALCLQFTNGWASSKKDVFRRWQQNVIDRLKLEVEKMKEANLTRGRAQQIESGDVVAEAHKLTNAFREEQEADDLAIQNEKEEEKTARELIPGDPHDVEQKADLHTATGTDTAVDDDDYEDDDTKLLDAAIQQLASKQIHSDQSRKRNEIDEKEEKKINEIFNHIEIIHRRRALIKKCATRWMTYVTMCERVLIWRDAFHQAIDEIYESDHIFRVKKTGGDTFNVETIKITAEEAEILTQFVEVCGVAKQVLIESEGSKYPTIGRLLFCYTVLQKHFTAVSQDPKSHEIIQSFCKKVIHMLEIKFDMDGEDRVAVIAACLDPRYRQLHFLPAETKKEFQMCLWREWNKLHQKERTTTVRVVEQPLKKMKIDLNAIGGFYTQAVETQSEYDNWCAGRNISPEADILEWWKMHEEEFPVLARLAKRYLSIPASSAPSERVFSNLKNIVTQKRVHLSGVALCQLLFVRHQQPSLFS
jgi:hypothetical protein